MKRIVLATGNKAKLNEFRQMLTDYDVVCPRDLGIAFDVDETGETFYENALIKARALNELVGEPTIADDSGLCVDALDGGPGVRSARYSGGGDDENNAKLLAELKDKPNRAAHFTSCIAYYDGERIISAEGYTHGVIADALDGDNGFGYDPLFISDDLHKTFGRASEDEKNAVSHRARALALLKRKLADEVGGAE